MHVRMIRHFMALSGKSRDTRLSPEAFVAWPSLLDSWNQLDAAKRVFQLPQVSTKKTEGQPNRLDSRRFTIVALFGFVALKFTQRNCMQLYATVCNCCIGDIVCFFCYGPGSSPVAQLSQNKQERPLLEKDGVSVGGC